MKIPSHERKKIDSGRRKAKRPPPNPETIEVRCEREGVKTNPRTIRGRMQKYGLTFEEAVAFQAKDRSAAGRAGKKNSYWNKTTPNSPADHDRAKRERKRLASKQHSLEQPT